MKGKLSNLLNKWKLVSERIGNVISSVILTILYFTLFAFIGILSRLLSDRLNMKKTKASYWMEASNKVPRTIEESKEQG